MKRLEKSTKYFQIHFSCTKWKLLSWRKHHLGGSKKNTYRKINRFAMVSCSRLIWITNSSDHRRVWTANLLNLAWISLRIVFWPSGLGNYFVCKRFAVQILIWSLEFVIQINLEQDTIAVWNLPRSWSIPINRFPKGWLYVFSIFIKVNISRRIKRNSALCVLPSTEINFEFIFSMIW